MKRHGIALTLLTTALALGCTNAQAQEEPVTTEEEVIEEREHDEARDDDPERRARAHELRVHGEELQRHVHELTRQLEEAHHTLRSHEQEFDEQRREVARADREMTDQIDRLSARIEAVKGEGGQGKDAELLMAGLLRERAAVLEKRAETAAARERLGKQGELQFDELRRRAVQHEKALDEARAEVERVRLSLAELGVEPPRGPDRPFRGEHRPDAAPRHRDGRRGPPEGRPGRGDAPFARGPGPRSGPRGERREGPGGVDQRLEHLERAVRELHELLGRHGVGDDDRRRGEHAVRRRFDGQGPGPRGRQGPGAGPDAWPRRGRDGERPRPPSGADRAPMQRGPGGGLDRMTEQLRDMTQRAQSPGEHPHRPSPEQIERFRQALEAYLRVLKPAPDRRPPGRGR